MASAKKKPVVPKKKTAAPKTAKKKTSAIDAELTPEKLLERAARLEEERRARGAEAAKKPQTLREPVEIRPAGPLQFTYPWDFDEALPPAEREELLALFRRFTKVGPEGGAFLAVAAGTLPEKRRSAWDQGGTVVEIEQLRAQLPEADPAKRMARLERALARPSYERWPEAVMLLSTWEEATRPAAIALAEKLLARWPDALRTLPAAWKERRDLQPLARVAWGTIEDTLADRDPAQVTVLQTQDVEGLRAQRARFTALRTLDLSGQTGLADVVLECRELASLERLVLQQPTYTKGTATLDLAKLLAAPHLQGLKALSLYGYSLGEKDVEALAKAPQKLERLRIQYASMKPAAAKHLAALASRTKLVSLDLKYNDLGPKGAATLFGSGDWSALEVLDFSANEIGDKGAAAIAAAGATSLRWLDLSSNANKQQLSAAGARALAASTSLGKLESLNVFGHPVGAEGVAALVGSANLRSLRALSAAFPDTDLAAILEACGAQVAPALEELNLGFSRRSKKPGDWSRAAFLEKVRVLNLSPLPGNEYAGLFGCPHLGALEILSLGSPSDVEPAFEALATAAPPPGLRYLDLTGWKLTTEQAERFAVSPIAKKLWGLSLLSSYITPEAWRPFYDAGLPLVGSAVFACDPASDTSYSTTFREEM